MGGTVPWGDTEGFIKREAHKKGVLSQLTFRLNLNPDSFLEELHALHFISPLIKSEEYNSTILSDCVPLAISLGIPLILRRSLANAYSIHSQIIYNRHFSEVLPVLKNITPSNYYSFKGALKKDFDRFHHWNTKEFVKLIRNVSSS